MSKVMVFVKEHPVETGLGVVAIIAVLFLLTRGGGGSSSSGDSGAAAYYAAQAQQSNNSAAIQIAQDNDTATTAQTQIAADASTTNNKTWADVQTLGITDNYNIGMVNANNAVSLANIQANVDNFAASNENASYADYINMENSLLAAGHFSGSVATPNYHPGH